MTDTAEKQEAKARIVSVLTDSYARIDIRGRWWRPTEEQHVSNLRDWYNDFIRDHRSQDDAQIDIVEVREDQCSVCDQRWEDLPLDDDAIADGYDPEKRYCSYCAAELESEPKP